MEWSTVERAIKTEIDTRTEWKRVGKLGCCMSDINRNIPTTRGWARGDPYQTNKNPPKEYSQSKLVSLHRVWYFTLALFCFLCRPSILSSSRLSGTCRVLRHVILRHPPLRTALPETDDARTLWCHRVLPLSPSATSGITDRGPGQEGGQQETHPENVASGQHCWCADNVELWGPV